MRNKILQLEEKARLLEPNAGTRKAWTGAVNEYAESFLSEIETLKAWNETTAKGEGILDLPIADHPRKMEDLLSVIEKEVDYPALNPKKRFGLRDWAKPKFPISQLPKNLGWTKSN